MSKISVDEPLGLAVHSLPTLQEAVQEGVPRGGRLKLMAIILVCSLPIIAACFAYFFLRPQGQAALGELIQPVRTMPTAPVQDLLGQPQALAPLKGQWLLVTVASGTCDDDCRQRLFLQRQLREILGKEKNRVDRVWLISDNATPPTDLGSLTSDLTTLRASAEVLTQWLPLVPGKQFGDYIFVVDPMGNAMMRLPSRFDTAQANKARRDLERLLRASSPWDPAGRPTGEADPLTAAETKKP